MNKRLFSSYSAVAMATMVATAVLTACGPTSVHATPAPYRVAQQGAHVECVTALQPESKPGGA